MNRKIVTGIIAGAAVVLIAVFAVLLLRGRQSAGKAELLANADTEALYSYMMAMTPDGLLVTVTGGKDGYSWKAETSDFTVVLPEQQDAAEGETAYLLAPLKDGFTRVSLNLLYDRSCGVCGYQIFLDLNVADGALSVRNNGHIELMEPIEDADKRYMLYQEADASYVVRLKADEKAAWQFSADSDAVTGGYYEPFDRAGMAELGVSEAELAALPEFFRFRCSGEEPVTVLIEDTGRGETLRIQMDCAEGLGMVPYACEMFSEPRGDASDSVEAELRAILDNMELSDKEWDGFVIPGDSLKQGTLLWTTQDGKHSENADCLLFERDGIPYLLWCFRTLTAAELAETDAETVEKAITENGMWAGTNGTYDSRVIWRGNDAETYLLRGYADAAALEIVRDTASLLIGES